MCNWIKWLRFLWGWHFIAAIQLSPLSYLAFTLMGWVFWPLLILVFLASISAPYWPNIWQGIGFSERFDRKTIGSIHFIPDNQPYGVSLKTPIHFHVPTDNCSSVVPNICPKSEFRDLICSTHSDCKIGIFVEYFCIWEAGYVAHVFNLWRAIRKPNFISRRGDEYITERATATIKSSGLNHQKQKNVSHINTTSTKKWL